MKHPAPIEGYFGKVFDSYWRGPTGRAIQACGTAAVILGAYLPSTRHANLIGLYELPLPYLEHDLPVLSAREIRTGLAGLADVGYAFYDASAAMIWVVEMARIRCGLTRHEPLKPDDNRHPAVVRLYRQVKATPLLTGFYDRYVEQLRLGPRRVLEAPSKPLPSPLQGPRKLDSRSVESSTYGKNALRAQAQPVEKSPKVPTLAALLRTELLPRMNGSTDEGDVIEAAKHLAAKHHLRYTGSAIRRALASARAQLAKRGHA